MSYSDLQSMSEIPAIAYFCSLFSQAFNIQDFEIQELEDALLHRANSEDMFDGTFLDNLLVSLLRGCLPSYRTIINSSNYSSYLRTLISTKIEEYEEENLSGPVAIFDPFNAEEEFRELSLEDRVKVLKQLTEFRLEAEDVQEKIKNIPVDSLRLDPLGVDSDGVIYWYFYGTRLYKEILGKRKQAKEKKPKASEKEKTEKVKKKKKDEEKEKDVMPPGWYLACHTEQDWNNLVEAFKKSKKKAEKELYDVLSENFLPDVVKMFQDKEREEQLAILMLNKRSSSRIDRKKKEHDEKQKELDEINRREEEKRRKEETEKIRKEKENNSRENRKRQREIKLDGPADESASIREERERRILEREMKRSIQLQEQHDGGQVEEEGRSQTKRTRMDAELRRRVERDHDYLGWGRRAGGGRKAAATEWNRLQSPSSEDESQTVRSIRF